MKTVLVIAIFCVAWICLYHVNETALRAYERVQFMMDMVPIPWEPPIIPLTTRI